MTRLHKVTCPYYRNYRIVKNIFSYQFALNPDISQSQNPPLALLFSLLGTSPRIRWLLNTLHRCAESAHGGGAGEGSGRQLGDHSSYLKIQPILISTPPIPLIETGPESKNLSPGTNLWAHRINFIIHPRPVIEVRSESKVGWKIK